MFTNFMLNYADTELVSNMDVDGITPTPTHYIDSNGLEWISDLVFSCPLKNDANAKAVVVFEHTGNRFEDLPIRLLFYAFAIWSLEFKEGKKTLSAIYFIVLRTGKPYRGAYPEISDWLTKDINGKILGFAPEIKYIVVDLSKMEVDQICGSPVLKTSLCILKNMTEGNEEEFAKLMAPLAEIEDEQERKMIIKDILTFVAEVLKTKGKVLKNTKVKEAIKYASKKEEEVKNTMKDIFDKLKEEGVAIGEAIGVAKGKTEGEMEGMQKMVLLALQKKFAKTPRRIATTIRNIFDPVALETLLGNVIDSRSLDEFKTALK